MEIIDEIVDYLVREKVSTTEVADALGKQGGIPDIMPLNRGQYQVGKIKWVYACEESNWTVHNQIQRIDENQIVFIDSFQCYDRALIGELVCKYLFVYCKANAVVVRGKVRDAAGLIQMNWPIWCTGCNPIGCFKEKPVKDIDDSLKIKYRDKYDGGIAICDDCGVVVIPKRKANINLLNALYCVENQEKIWFDRLDQYKENTYEIVCEKKYLTDKFYMEMQQKKRI